MATQTFVVVTTTHETTNQDLTWEQTIIPPVHGDTQLRVHVPISAFEVYGRTMEAERVVGRVAIDQIQRLFNVGACLGDRLAYAPTGNGVVVVEVDFEV